MVMDHTKKHFFTNNKIIVRLIFPVDHKIRIQQYNSNGE